jgi:hypothetical protein
MTANDDTTTIKLKMTSSEPPPSSTMTDGSSPEADDTTTTTTTTTATTTTSSKKGVRIVEHGNREYEIPNRECLDKGTFWWTKQEIAQARKDSYMMAQIQIHVREKLEREVDYEDPQMLEDRIDEISQWEPGEIADFLQTPSSPETTTVRRRIPAIMKQQQNVHKTNKDEKEAYMMAQIKFHVQQKLLQLEEYEDPNMFSERIAEICKRTPAEIADFLQAPMPANKRKVPRKKDSFDMMESTPTDDAQKDTATKRQKLIISAEEESSAQPGDDGEEEDETSADDDHSASASSHSEEESQSSTTMDDSNDVDDDDDVYVWDEPVTTTSPASSAEEPLEESVSHFEDSDDNDDDDDDTMQESGSNFDNSASEMGDGDDDTGYELGAVSTPPPPEDPSSDDPLNEKRPSPAAIVDENDILSAFSIPSDGGDKEEEDDTTMDDEAPHDKWSALTTTKTERATSRATNNNTENDSDKEEADDSDILGAFSLESAPASSSSTEEETVSPDKVSPTLTKVATRSIGTTDTRGTSTFDDDDILSAFSTSEDDDDDDDKEEKETTKQETQPAIHVKDTTRSTIIETATTSTKKTMTRNATDDIDIQEDDILSAFSMADDRVDDDSGGKTDETTKQPPSPLIAEGDVPFDEVMEVTTTTTTTTIEIPPSSPVHENHHHEPTNDAAEIPASTQEEEEDGGMQKDDDDIVLSAVSISEEPSSAHSQQESRPVEKPAENYEMEVLAEANSTSLQETPTQSAAGTVQKEDTPSQTALDVVATKTKKNAALTPSVKSKAIATKTTAFSNLPSQYLWWGIAIVLLSIFAAVFMGKSNPFAILRAPEDAPQVDLEAPAVEV